MCFCHLFRTICRIFSEMTFVGDLAECMLQILSLQKLRKMAWMWPECRFQYFFFAAFRIYFLKTWIFSKFFLLHPGFCTRRVPWQWCKRQTGFRGETKPSAAIVAIVLIFCFVLSLFPDFSNSLQMLRSWCQRRTLRDICLQSWNIFWQLVLTLKRGLAIEPQVEERSGVSWLSLLHLHDSLLAGDLPLPKGATRLHNSSAGAV